MLTTARTPTPALLLLAVAALALRQAQPLLPVHCAATVVHTLTSGIWSTLHNACTTVRLKRNLPIFHFCRDDGTVVITRYASTL
jgi:hypothetical protein